MPVTHRYCSMESLVDGTLDLADVALLNELIEVQAENARRITEHARATQLKWRR